MNDYIQRTMLDPTGARREVRASFEYITPEIAAEYLKKNIEHNRKIEQKRLYGYIRDMKHYSWWFTGDTIKFNERGQLCDGQFRLTAIVRSKMPQTLLVVRGVAEPAVLHMDKGKTRSLKDSLSIAQDETPLNNQAMIQLVRSVIKYCSERGHYHTTDDDVRRVFDRYSNEFITIHRIFPKNESNMNGSTQAAFFAALVSGVNQSTLAEYLKVFLSRDPSHLYNDEAALKWEKYIHNLEKNHVRMTRDSLFFGFQNSLYFFVTGKRYQMPKEWVYRYSIKEEIISLLDGFKENIFIEEEK